MRVGDRAIVRAAPLAAVERSEWTEGEHVRARGDAACGTRRGRTVRRYLSGAEYDRDVISSVLGLAVDTPLDISLHALASMLMPEKPHSVSVELKPARFAIVLIMVRVREVESCSSSAGMSARRVVLRIRCQRVAVGDCR